MPRRPILLALLIAALTTGGVLLLVRAGSGQTDARVAVGSPAPAIAGSTLDGAAFDPATMHGKPVVINFWGPSCVPCRDEFPLLAAKLAQHAADGFTVVGVLTDDPVQPARDFVASYRSTWPTVVDPGNAMKAAYRVAARPQTYFVDRNGIVRSIQIGQLTDADFERQYARISP
ncbi:MAG: cytochrome c biosis protein CcmG, thiol:disulfide interchange protein DsbE [Chloroflexota bacterium]|jgi:cytochrome c biogenesis protein CcmG/thiol:disulfide interchange protein DsbE|nr:cytochrome c biosis protein CcmG, thiol:disulfide interchange protein DsbE [Chloroflexota bacterium]MEA2654300.1 cytochrome c biosis protein CcmG, thiol:disulfide interchange protein DsbE [Chloroflexota bacterium]